MIRSLRSIAFILAFTLGGTIQAQIFVDSTGSNGFGDLPHPMAKSRFSNTDHEYNLFVRTTGVDTLRGVGIYNFLDAGTAEKFGIWNHIEQASGATGLTFGVRNVVTHGGDADAYGVYNDLSGTAGSKGRLFGNYSLLDDKGARAPGKMYANFYGETVHRRKNNAYGSYLLVKSRATGTNKASYGQYIDIRGNGDADRYGVYSNIHGGPGYAGYFVGDVHINGAFTQASDERLKKNVRKIKGALEIIQSLKPHTYNYKPSEQLGFGDAEAVHYGFLAQEVAKVLPDLVTEVHHTYTEEAERVGQMELADELGVPSFGAVDAVAGAKSLGAGDGSVGAADIRGVRYLDMIALLVGAVQEQGQKIEDRDEALVELRQQLVETQDQVVTLSRSMEMLRSCAQCADTENSPNQQSVKLSIYPNPTGGELVLTYQATEITSARARIVATNGSVVVDQVLTGSNTVLSSVGWPAGVYIVEIYEETTKELIASKQLVVQ